MQVVWIGHDHNENKILLTSLFSLLGDYDVTDH